MAAAISPADRTLNPVISVSPLDTEAERFGVCFENEWSDRRFKLNIFSWSFTGARGRRRKRSQIPARACHVPLRVNAPSAAKSFIHSSKRVFRRFAKRGRWPTSTSSAYSESTCGSAGKNA
jgi:hypothetical protein